MINKDIMKQSGDNIIIAICLKTLAFSSGKVALIEIVEKMPLTSQSNESYIYSSIYI